MKRISLNATLNCAYRVIDNEVLGIKASVISICSDIDRYFKLRFDLDISSEDIGLNQYFEIIKVFPQLSRLSLSQFNHLLDVFTNIRDINAHLHLCKEVEVNEDLCDYLITIVKPEYDIVSNGKLTMYGQSYIISFIAQKYNLWPFYISYFKRTHFEETYNMKGDAISKFQTGEQHKMQNFCGIGKPINTTNYSSHDFLYLNDLFKKYMTNIVFSLEKECSHTRKSTNHSKSLARYMSSAYVFDTDEESYNLMIFLRNCWFHGVLLNEVVEFDNEKKLLSFEFVMESFIKIKATLKKNDDMFYRTITNINEFANAILNYYVLRLVEVSYKVLDSRLLTEDKVDSRIDGLVKAYNRFINTDTNYFDLAGRLIDPEYMEFRVGGPKFLDKISRKTICDNLKIVKLHSISGFEIGEFKTNKQDLYFVLIDLDEKYQNRINGKYIYEYSIDIEIKYGSKISVFENVGEHITNNYQELLQLNA